MQKLKDEFEAVREEVSDMKAWIGAVERGLQESKENIKKNKKALDIALKSQVVIVEAERVAQKKFREDIESAVSIPIQSVFDADYQFILDFKERKDRSECVPLIQEGDNEPESPRTEMGGGILDIASFALRLFVWGKIPMEERPIPFFYLDEPMKSIGSGELLFKSIRMIRDVVKSLDMQVIINTHIPEFASIGDRVFRFTKGSDRVTKVKVLTEGGVGNGGETSKTNVRGKRKKLEKK